MNHRIIIPDCRLSRIKEPGSANREWWNKIFTATFYAHVRCCLTSGVSIEHIATMSDEGPSEKKIKMADRIVVDSPLAPPAIGLWLWISLPLKVARSITNIYSDFATLIDDWCNMDTILGPYSQVGSRIDWSLPKKNFSYKCSARCLLSLMSSGYQSKWYGLRLRLLRDGSWNQSTGSWRCRSSGQTSAHKFEEHRWRIWIEHDQSCQMHNPPDRYGSLRRS